MHENIIWQRSDLKFVDDFLFNEETEYDKDFYRLIFYETYLKETLNDIDFNPSLTPLESNFSNLNNNNSNSNSNNNNDQSGYSFINLCPNFCFKLLTFNNMKENSEFVSDKNNNNNNDAISNLKFWTIENYLNNDYSTNKQAPKKKLLKLDLNEKNDLLKNLTQFTENNERKFDISINKNDSNDNRSVTETDFDQTGSNLNFLNLKNNLNNSFKMDKNRVDLVNQTLTLVTSNKNVRSSFESSKKSSLGDSLINEAFSNLGVNLSDISTCSGSFSFKLSNHESSCNSLSNRTI